jgi:hypothetical protein
MRFGPVQRPLGLLIFVVVAMPGVWDSDESGPEPECSSSSGVHSKVCMHVRVSKAYVFNLFALPHRGHAV